jgi:hypothetical protein
MKKCVDCDIHFIALINQFPRRVYKKKLGLHRRSRENYAGFGISSIMSTHGLCSLSLGFSVLPRISLLASFERADIIWKSFT